MAGTKFKQVVSSFLALAFAVTLFPVSASAAFDEDARIYATHYVNNASVTASSEINQKLTPTANLDPKTDPQWYASTESINLWVYSTDMTEDETNDGNSIPYVKDNQGNTYYLQKIEWRNSTSSSDATVETIMDSTAITTAANNGSTQYSFKPSAITADPDSGSYEWWAPDYSDWGYINYTAYYIYYYWTSTPPDQWDGEVTPLETYSIKYMANLPTGLTNQNIYPVRTDGSMVIGNTGFTESNLNEEFGKYQTSVKENLNFTIAEGGQYKDYLVFGDQGYYAFAGWKDETGNIYKTQDDTCTVQATSALAGEDDIITLTAQWELFYPTGQAGSQTEAQAKAAQKLADAQTAWNNAENPNFKIDVLERDSSATSENVLLTQWSSLYGEPDFGEYSGDTVYLDETGTIHYRATARLDGDVNSFAQDSAIQNFATFTLSLKVDKNLEFVSGTDGTASFTFNCPFLKPKNTNITGAKISDNPDENGNYTITFSPSSIQSDSDEDGCMTITVTAEWIPKVYSATGNTLRQPMTLDNLVFQLKDDVQTQGLQLQTSANITATIDLTQTGESRTLYQKARSLLTTSPNDAWTDIFGEPSDPMAVALAAEFLNGKLENYDLSQDAKALLNPNTASAIVVEPGIVSISPADITVYEGGDGGYDAVVGDTGTTSSNSLPHPMFRITTPDDTDPKDLTFHNGDKSWTVISDGNGYYHFSEGEGQDNVRVTYSYKDKDGVKHTVTEDAFDPATMGDVYGKLTIELYPGENNLNDVTATTKDDKTYRITAKPGTLIVRAVENSDPTSPIEKAAPTEKVSAGTAKAVEPENTIYTLNNTGVQLPAGSEPSLLFDDIIDTDADRTSALEDRIDSYLGGADADREYQIKYLDLVDANNGNAWITSSAGTDIYWGYPTGTDRNTNFTLLHFTGLHRDGTNSGFDLDDIAGAAIERIDVENTENGIKFHVDSGGFSPFALVWEERGPIVPPTTYYTITATAGEGGAIAPDGTVRVTQGADRTFTISAAEGYVIADVLVDGESIGAVDRYTFENVRQNHTIEARFQPVSDVADPDDTGVSDWLNTDDHLAYLDGYPDNTFQPEEDMTRAEAAQMFYNLLRDQDVDTTVSFTDVAADAWYAEAVNTLATLEIVDGVGDNRFAPERTITRAEFTTMAMRFCQEIPTGENIFSDVDQDDWFYDYVVGSIQYGWINGYPDGTFRPNDTITRAEVTTIANRMLGRAADEAYVDGHQDQLRAFPDVTKGYWAYYDITEATNAHEYTKDSQGEDWTGLA